MIEKLFIYGTLGPGRPNEHIMTKIGGTWEGASIMGTLKQEDWGAEMGYPGISFEQAGEKINGFIFSSENLSINWAMLDEFEGEAYERILKPVKLKDNTMVDAYIYALKATQ